MGQPITLSIGPISDSTNYTTNGGSVSDGSSSEDAIMLNQKRERREKLLQSIGYLFYLLQTQPNYLAILLRKILNILNDSSNYKDGEEYEYLDLLHIVFSNMKTNRTKYLYLKSLTNLLFIVRPSNNEVSGSYVENLLSILIIENAETKSRNYLDQVVEPILHDYHGRDLCIVNMDKFKRRSGSAICYKSEQLAQLQRDIQNSSTDNLNNTINLSNNNGSNNNLNKVITNTNHNISVEMWKRKTTKLMLQEEETMQVKITTWENILDRIGAKLKNHLRNSTYEYKFKSAFIYYFIKQIMEYVHSSQSNETILKKSNDYFIDCFLRKTKIRNKLLQQSTLTDPRTKESHIYQFLEIISGSDQINLHKIEYSGIVSRVEKIKDFILEWVSELNITKEVASKESRNYLYNLLEHHYHLPLESDVCHRIDAPIVLRFSQLMKLAKILYYNLNPNDEMYKTLNFIRNNLRYLTAQPSNQIVNGVAVSTILQNLYDDQAQLMNHHPFNNNYNNQSNNNNNGNASPVTIAIDEEVYNGSDFQLVVPVFCPPDTKRYLPRYIIGLKFLVKTYYPKDISGELKPGIFSDVTFHFKSNKYFDFNF
ncbi:hypothetical protein ABK040_006936 [Willaertia magna]